jgi:hypothetical protein
MRASDFRPLPIFLFASLCLAQSTQERVFHFKANDTAENIQQIANVIGRIGDSQELSTDAGQQTLTVRGTAGEIAFSEWLFNQLDNAEHSSKNQYRMSIDDDDIVQVFYLTNPANVQQVQEIATSVRLIAGVRRLFLYETSKTVVARGTTGQIALAGWLFGQVDKPAIGEIAAKSENSDAIEFSVAADGNDVVGVFYLTNTQSTQSFQELATLIRSVTRARRAFTYGASRAYMVRGTVEQIALARWLSRELDMPSQQDHGSLTHEYKLSGKRNEAVRVFYLNQSDTVAVFQKFVTDLRNTTNIREAFTYNGQRALALRGTVNEIAWAEQIIKTQNK